MTARHSGRGIKRGAHAPANRTRPRWQDDAAPLGQDENTEDSTTSTKTVRRKKTTAKNTEADKQPEWRRICHRYEGESQISMCGAALRGPGEDHWGEECAARGHGVCVVCQDLVAIKYGIT